MHDIKQLEQEAAEKAGFNSYKEFNQRRADLIHKEVRETISPEESLELNRLQKLSKEFGIKTFPKIFSFKKEIEEIKQKFSSQSEKDQVK